MAAIKGHGEQRGQRLGAIDGAQVWWVAPTLKVADKIWRDLKKSCRHAWTYKNETTRRIELPGGGSVTIKSGDDPETLVGEGLDGVIIDEAAKVKRDVWDESIRPALADRQGWTIFIGTPKGRGNWFFGLFEAAGDPTRRGSWARWQQPTSANPTISPDEIADLSATMTAAKHAQEIEARFVGDGGELFPRDKAVIIDAAPAGITRPVRYWDKAGSDTDGDFTAGGLVARHDGLTYVLDMVHGRWGPMERNKVIATTCGLDAARWGRHGWSLWLEQEPGNGGKESALVSVRELAAYGPRVETPATNKVARAEHFAAQWQAGNVRILRGPWNAKYLDELAAFPDEDVHDDMVDASTGAFNKLMLAPAPTRIARPVARRI